MVSTVTVDRGPAAGPPVGPGAAEASLQARIQVTRDGGFELDLELEVEPGTTLALLGPNGAGKSTTVETLAGTMAIEQGRITLGDRVLDEPATGRFVPPEQRRIGVVFQQYLLFDHLSVLDNVAFGPMSRGVKRQQARQGAAGWLDRLDLGGLENRRPPALSGGQAQRVAVARALASEPALLLLDEPLAALDVATRTTLRRVLRRHLREFTGPRLLITHEPVEAFVMADFILVLEHGRVSQRGTVPEIRRHPATPYVAALAGTNFLTGINDRGAILVDGSNFELRTSGTQGGPVQVVIDPRAISLYRHRPDGSPRNTWPTTIDWIEPLGETTRVRLGGPLPVMADITPSAAASLELRPGDAIWAVVKATEVSVRPG